VKIGGEIVDDGGGVRIGVKLLTATAEEEEEEEWKGWTEKHKRAL